MSFESVIEESYYDIAIDQFRWLSVLPLFFVENEIKKNIGREIRIAGYCANSTECSNHSLKNTTNFSAWCDKRI